MLIHDSDTCYANSVWAPDVPTFVSVNETVYGFESDWQKFIVDRQDKVLSDDVYLDAWSQWVDGDVGVTVNVAYADEQFMRSVNILGYWRGTVPEGSTIYRNIWGYDYTFEYSKFDVDVLWVSDFDGYHRVIKYGMGQLFLDNKVVSSVMCDYGILSVFKDYISSNVFLIDTSFSSLSQVYDDIKHYNADVVRIEPLIRYVIGDG